MKLSHPGSSCTYMISNIPQYTFLYQSPGVTNLCYVVYNLVSIRALTRKTYVIPRTLSNVCHMLLTSLLSMYLNVGSVYYNVTRLRLTQYKALPGNAFPRNIVTA